MEAIHAHTTPEELREMQLQADKETAKAWTEEFEKDPKLQEKFLMWCADQGHLQEYYELYINPPEEPDHDDGPPYGDAIDDMDGASELPPLKNNSSQDY